MSTTEIKVTPSRKKGGYAYSANPFDNEIIINVSNKTIKIGDRVIIETQVENNEFVDAYINEMKKAFELKKASLLILETLIILEKSMQSTDLQYLKCKEYTPNLSYDFVNTFWAFSGKSISRTTYHRAINELIEKGFIAESENNDRFWINHKLLKTESLALTNVINCRAAI